MYRRTALSSWLLPHLVLSALLLAACQEGGPARPDLSATASGRPTSSPDRPRAIAGVSAGPALLRRLSNREYRYSLADLFPGLALELPALPDDADVAGFDNAAEAQVASDVHIARYEAIAQRYAEAATADASAVRALVGCDYTAADAEQPCARAFLESTGRRIFRRRLSADELERFMLLFQRAARAVDFEAGVQLTLSALLQSPQFLYRVEAESNDQQPGVFALDRAALASRLAFFLWQSTPDEALLAAADDGKLDTEEGLADVAERMLRDPRVSRVMWDFHRQWLGLDRILGAEHGERAPSVHPSWSSVQQRASWEESRRFVEHVMSDDAKLSSLLLSPRAWLDAETAALYGVPAPAELPGEVELPRTERAGLLTRVAFLAGFSHRGTTSPPLRANAVQLRMLCRPSAAPPPGVDTSPPLAEPDSGPQTTRMLFEAKTRAPTCQGCHVSLNGLGFGFEQYDAAGRYRSLESGLPIDASGALVHDQVRAPFDGAIQLSEQLASSHEVARCAVQSWLRFALGRASLASEAELIERLSQRFAEDGGDVRALLRAIVLSPSFRYYRVGSAP